MDYLSVCPRHLAWFLVLAHLEARNIEILCRKLDIERCILFEDNLSPTAEYTDQSGVMVSFPSLYLPSSTSIYSHPGPVYNLPTLSNDFPRSLAISFMRAICLAICISRRAFCAFSIEALSKPHCTGFVCGYDGRDFGGDLGGEGFPGGGRVLKRVRWLTFFLIQDDGFARSRIDLRKEVNSRCLRIRWGKDMRGCDVMEMSCPDCNSVTGVGGLDLD
jgi:hypothetical protein